MVPVYHLHLLEQPSLPVMKNLAALFLEFNE